MYLKKVLTDRKIHDIISIVFFILSVPDRSENQAAGAESVKGKTGRYSFVIKIYDRLSAVSGMSGVMSGQVCQKPWDTRG